MAKVFKAEIYIVDNNGFYESFEEIQNDLERGLYGDPIVFTFGVKESKEFEWDDDIDLNYNNCSQENCDRYLEERKDG
jgi:hypothetical protein